MVKMPKAVFRIGVVGHRPDKLSTKTMEALPSVLAKLFSTLDIEVRETFKKAGPMYDQNTPTVIRLVSGLAAGADLMAAETAQSLAWQTQFLLPESLQHFKARLSSDEQLRFEQVLSQSSSLTEVTVYGEEALTSDPHAALGQLLLQNIDLLVTVWDGAPGRGKGGTADLVTEALEKQIPVLWLDAADPSRIQYLDSAMTQSVTDNEHGWQQKTQRYLDTVLLPPTQHDEPQAFGRLQEYAGEKERRWNLGLAFPIFQFLFTGRSLRFSDLYQSFAAETQQKAWQKELQGDSTGALAQTGSTVFAQYAQADRLANYYAQLYRSASVMNYTLTAVSVLMALMGLLKSEWKLWWVLLELGLISLVLINTAVGNKARWHQKWLDYRQLAESLRVMLKLSPLAINGQLFSSQLAQVHHGQGGRWIEWYLSAVNRCATLPGIEINTAIVDKFRHELADYAGEQSNYHASAAKNAYHTDHRLHIVGNICLYGTVLSCLIFLVCYLAKPDLAAQLKNWVTFYCAVLPAFGAAAFGLRHHGDYEGVAQRSTSTASHLVEFKCSISKNALGFIEMVTLAHQLKGHYYLDLRDWRVTFERRPLAVPA